MKYWTRERIIDALCAWHEAHGEVPRQRDWRNASADHPKHNAVFREFGSWTAAIRSAGLEPDPRNRLSPSSQTGRWRRVA